MRLIKFWFPLSHSTHNNIILGVMCRSEKFKIGVCAALIFVIDKAIFFDININAWVVISLNEFEPDLNQMLKAPLAQLDRASVF